MPGDLLAPAQITTSSTKPFKTHSLAKIPSYVERHTKFFRLFFSVGVHLSDLRNRLSENLKSTAPITNRAMN